MTREELKNIVRHVFRFYDMNADNCNWADMNEACGEIIKALEQEPYEKFESVKDHICKLAGDYKCWDNRLTADEALELCRMLEQEPCVDAVSRNEVVEWLQRASDDSIRHAIDSNLEFIPSVTPKLPGYVDAVSRIEVDRLCYRYLKVATDEHVAFYEDFLDLPSVTPIRKKGRWIYTPHKRLVDETDEGPVYEIQEKCSCSACGADFGYRKVDDNYCKYCGAEMECE